MAELILDWVDNTLEDSKVQWAYIEAQELDDSFGWGAMTKTLVSRMGSRGNTPKERSRRSCGLLLTGPDGCGKHTAAAHMMTHLWPHAYEMVFLSGHTLALLGKSGCIQHLDALLEVCINKQQAVCIQLEDMEDCPHRRMVLTYLGQQLRNYWISDFPPLFLILIDSREQDIPACLRSQLLLCRMTLPSQAQRTALLNTFAKDLRNTLSLELFAEHTEGASYAQLLDMVSALNWLVDSQDLYQLEDAALLDFLDSQMPIPTQEDHMKGLAKSAETFVEQLPDLLKTLASIRPSPLPNPVPNPIPQPGPVPDPVSYADQQRKRIDNLPPKDLALELFGEKGVREISQRASELDSSRQLLVQ